MIFHIDAKVNEGLVDIYMLMDLPSGFLMCSQMTLSELTEQQANELIIDGKNQKNITPRRILLAKGGPAEKHLRKADWCVVLRILLRDHIIHHQPQLPCRWVKFNFI